MSRWRHINAVEIWTVKPTAAFLSVPSHTEAGVNFTVTFVFPFAGLFLGGKTWKRDAFFLLSPSKEADSHTHMYSSHGKHKYFYYHCIVFSLNTRESTSACSHWSYLPTTTLILFTHLDCASYINIYYESALLSQWIPRTITFKHIINNSRRINVHAEPQGKWRNTRKSLCPNNLVPYIFV